MTGCGANESRLEGNLRESEKTNTTSPSNDNVASVHIENYTGVIVGVEDAGGDMEEDMEEDISANAKLRIELSDGGETIVCELLGIDTSYPNADILNIGDSVDLDCEVSVLDGVIQSRSVLSIKVVREKE